MCITCLQYMGRPRPRHTQKDTDREAGWQTGRHWETETQRERHYKVLVIIGLKISHVVSGNWRPKKASSVVQRPESQRTDGALNSLGGKIWDQEYRRPQTDVLRQRVSSAFLPWFRGSADWMVPLHTGADHGFYSAHWQIAHLVQKCLPRLPLGWRFPRQPCTFQAS